MESFSVSSRSNVELIRQAFTVNGWEEQEELCIPELDESHFGWLAFMPSFPKNGSLRYCISLDT
jgi:hypothetical protein